MVIQSPLKMIRHVQLVKIKAKNSCLGVRTRIVYNCIIIIIIIGVVII